MRVPLIARARPKSAPPAHVFARMGPHVPGYSRTGSCDRTPSSRRPPVPPVHHQSAVDAECLPGHVVRPRRQEEADHLGDMRNRNRCRGIAKTSGSMLTSLRHRARCRWSSQDWQHEIGIEGVGTRRPCCAPSGVRSLCRARHGREDHFDDELRCGEQWRIIDLLRSDSCAHALRHKEAVRTGNAGRSGSDSASLGTGQRRAIATRTVLVHAPRRLKPRHPTPPLFQRRRW